MFVVGIRIKHIRQSDVHIDQHVCIVSSEKKLSIADSEVQYRGKKSNDRKNKDIYTIQYLIECSSDIYRRNVT